MTKAEVSASSAKCGQHAFQIQERACVHSNCAASGFSVHRNNQHGERVNSVVAIQPVSIDGLLPRMRCPRSLQALVRKGDALESRDGRHRYPIANDVVDMRVPPERLQVNLRWVEIWDELDALRFELPPPLEVNDLPRHLDARLASIPGEQGGGRWLIEIGCGERLCEAYFTQRGFRYVGTDVDVRGRGPHVLADAHNLPFADGSFDLYASMAVYEHLASPLLAAIEARRVLTHGGRFFGTSAFVYGFHDRASFNHMTHAGLLWTFRMAGF